MSKTRLRADAAEFRPSGAGAGAAAVLPPAVPRPSASAVRAATAARSARLSAASAEFAPKTTTRSGRSGVFSLSELLAIREAIEKFVRPECDGMAFTISDPTPAVRRDKGSSTPDRKTKKTEDESVEQERSWRVYEPKSLAEENLNPDGTTVLLVAEKPWKPRTLKSSETSGADMDMDVDTLKRKTLVFLNKLTLDNFDRLTTSFIDEVAVTSPEHVQALVEMVIEKAQAETLYGFMYAQLCVRLQEAIGTSYTTTTNLDVTAASDPSFQQLLLSSIQRQFLVERPLPPTYDEMDEDDQVEAKLVQRDMFVGHVAFLAELFKENLVSEKIMHVALRTMLQPAPVTPREDYVPCIQLFIETAGQKLDFEASNPRAAAFFDGYMEYMYQLLDTPALPTRTRFALLNLVELRANKWVPHREEDQVQTLDDFHATAHLSAKAARNKSKRRTAAAAAASVDADGWAVVGSGSSSRRPGGHKSRVHISHSKKDKDSKSRKSKDKDSERAHRSSTRSKHVSNVAVLSPASRRHESASGAGAGAGAGAGTASTPASTPKPASEPKTRAELKRHAKEMLQQFEANGVSTLDDAHTTLEEAVSCHQEPKAEAAAILLPQIAEYILDAVANSRKPLPSAEAAAKFFHAVMESTSDIRFQPEHVTTGFTCIAEFIDDIRVDVPLIISYFGRFLSFAATLGVMPLSSIEPSFALLLQPVVKSGSAGTLLAEALKALPEGTKPADFLAAQGVNVATWFPSDSDPAAVLASKGVSGL